MRYCLIFLLFFGSFLLAETYVISDDYQLEVKSHQDKLILEFSYSLQSKPCLIVEGNNNGHINQILITEDEHVYTPDDKGYDYTITKIDIPENQVLPKFIVSTNCFFDGKKSKEETIDIRLIYPERVNKLKYLIIEILKKNGNPKSLEREIKNELDKIIDGEWEDEYLDFSLQFPSGKNMLPSQDYALFQDEGRIILISTAILACHFKKTLEKSEISQVKSILYHSMDVMDIYDSLFIFKAVNQSEESVFLKISLGGDPELSSLNFDILDKDMFDKEEKDSFVSMNSYVLNAVNAVLKNKSALEEISDALSLRIVPIYEWDKKTNSENLIIFSSESEVIIKIE